MRSKFIAKFALAALLALISLSLNLTLGTSNVSARDNSQTSMSDWNWNLDHPANPCDGGTIPEPSTIVILASGAAASLVFAWYRRRSKA